VRIQRLNIENLRNLESVQIDLGTESNHFYGENGAGKTAILEAVHLLARGRSFRTGQMADLVRHGADGLLIRADLQDEHRGSLSVGMSRFRSGRGELRVNGERARRLSDVSALMPLQIMTPQLSELVFGGPGERRRWLDWGVFHVEQDHLRALRHYLHTLRQRNAALKSVATGQLPESALAVWTDELASAGEPVNERRIAYVASLAEPLAEVLAELSPDLCVSIGYSRGWPEQQPLLKVLGESLSKELKSGATQYGPHRADLLLSVDGGHAGAILSRGQGKALASALMLAQARWLFRAARRTSVFLIDDVGAELDAAHSHRFFRQLDELGVQVLATSSERRTGIRGLQPPVSGRNVTVFHVKHGQVYRVLEPMSAPEPNDGAT
jgi:DNA replication and repair protein RecF